MAATLTARMVAREVQSALAKRGVKRDVDAKRVRAWVRDNIDAYDDDGYTAHLYDRRTADRIVSALVSRYTGGMGTKGRASAASAGRSGTARKPSTTTHKAPPTRAMGSGPVTRTTPAPKPSTSATAAPKPDVTA